MLGVNTSSKRKVLKVIVTMAILLVVITGAVGYFFVFRHAAPSPELSVDEKVTLQRISKSDYTALTDNELGIRAKNDVGLTISQLEKGEKTDSLSFEKAYAGARILAATGKYSASLRLYGLAESKATNEQKGSSFYSEYSFISARANNPTLSKQLLEKQKEVIQKSALSADEKKRQIANVELMIREEE